MKRLKLNSQGVAHHFLLALIIVGVAIGGSYYLIRSFADTCDASSPTSSATSDAAISDPTTEPDSCDAVTEPVTSPVTAPATTTTSSLLTYAAMCSITANTTNYTVGQAVQPTISIRNTGTGAISPQISYDFKGPRGLTSTYTFPGTLSPRETTSAALPQFVLPAPGTYVMTVTSNTKDVPFTCSRAFTARSYTASCSITGVPNKVKLNKQFNPVVTMRNTGTGRVQIRNITLITNPNVGATSYKSKNFNLSLNPGQSSSKRFSDEVINSNKKIPKSAVIKAYAVADTSNNVSCSKTVKVVR